MKFYNCPCDFRSVSCVCQVDKGVDLVKEVRIDWSKPLEAWNGERSKPVRYVCDRVLTNEGRTRLLLVMEDTGNENVYFSDDFGNVGSTTYWRVRNVKETKVIKVYRHHSGALAYAIKGTVHHSWIESRKEYMLIHRHEFEV